jgi:hypothetical protein
MSDTDKVTSRSPQHFLVLCFKEYYSKHNSYNFPQKRKQGAAVPLEPPAFPKQDKKEYVLRNITQNIIMTFPKKRKVLKETWVSFTGFPLLGFLYLQN